LPNAVAAVAHISANSVSFRLFMAPSAVRVAFWLWSLIRDNHLL
jgi:hypothetical protein